MQAYIDPTVPISSTTWNRTSRSLTISFAGCNFRYPFSSSPHLFDFKAELLSDVRDIVRELRIRRDEADSVLLAGGEPLLQRLAAAEILCQAKALGLRTAMVTNCSKPDALRSLLQKKLLDAVYVQFHQPLAEPCFSRITSAGTFFKPSAAVIADVKTSLALLAATRASVTLQVEVLTLVVPSVLYKKEDLLDIASHIEPLHAVWWLEQFDPEAPAADRRLGALNPPSIPFMKNLRDAVLARFPRMEIRLIGKDGEEIG
ncbi:hypothetical protein JXB02_00775 [Candidatus Woesearchaeota archaeon]|nr:hypothetical protein [Candidatus Woesearchaeota archaeon]